MCYLIYNPTCLPPRARTFSCKVASYLHVLNKASFVSAFTLGFLRIWMPLILAVVHSLMRDLVLSAFEYKLFHLIPCQEVMLQDTVGCEIYLGLVPYHRRNVAVCTTYCWKCWESWCCFVILTVVIVSLFCYCFMRFITSNLHCIICCLDFHISRISISMTM